MILVLLWIFLFTYNIKNSRRVWCVWLLPFISKKIEKRKTHNMLSWMLDSQVKSFHLMFSFVDNEQGISIVEKYNKNLYILCFRNVVITYILWQIVKLDL
jgi:hypothetical protein